MFEVGKILRIVEIPDCKESSSLVVIEEDIGIQLFLFFA
jgi:hypothetical protein